MRTSPTLAESKTIRVAHARRASLRQDRTLTASRLSFFCLVGFVATQGYLVPLVSLPVNWAIWPSLPDLFGVGLVLSVALARRRSDLAPFDRDTLRDLLWMGLVFVANFLLVTMTSSETQRGIKFGGFALILWAKYLAVYWAAAHVPLDRKRTLILHLAALAAFMWLVGTTLADRFYLIEIDSFTSHLPETSAGYWSTLITGLDSTVAPRHGGTTVVVLMLGALVVGTARHRFATLVETLVFILGLGACFLSGGRQGLVRMTTFVIVYLLRKPTKYLVLAVSLTLLALIIYSLDNSPSLAENSNYLRALERQQILLTDPFSYEGLAGRSGLWQGVVDELSKEPIRWIIGYGIGNYVEYNVASHNMVLRFLQDGGIIELILVGFLWLRILRRVWAMRQVEWTIVALTVGILSSTLTSDILYPGLASAWYLGLYFVAMRVMLGDQQATDPSSRVANARQL